MQTLESTAFGHASGRTWLAGGGVGPCGSNDALWSDLRARQPRGAQPRVQRDRAPPDLQRPRQPILIGSGSGSNSSGMPCHPSLQVAAGVPCSKLPPSSAASSRPHLQHSGLDHVPLVHVPRQAHVVHAQHRQLALQAGAAAEQGVPRCQPAGAWRAAGPNEHRQPGAPAAKVQQLWQRSRCSALSQTRRQLLAGTNRQAASSRRLAAGSGGGASPRAPTPRSPVGWRPSRPPCPPAAGSRAASPDRWRAGTRSGRRACCWPRPLLPGPPLARPPSTLCACP